MGTLRAVNGDMSYEPSHRKPPRQERWPNATPGEGWPAYQQHGDGEGSWASTEALTGSSRNGYGAASNGYGDAFAGRTDAWAGQADAWGGRTASAWPPAGDGYADGFDGATDGYAADGYGQAQDYYQDQRGWDGYAQPGHEFTAPAGYQQQDEYPALEPGTSSVLVAPDTFGEWWRQPDAGPGRDLSRGLVVGAVTGVLAAAVAIGVATFAAAFVRPQASPASVLGSIFVDRIPAALKHSVMAHFGAHDRAVLLLGMYVALGLIAMVLGCMARRSPSVGVAGIAAFGLLAAFIVITRPASRASDVIPSAVGAVAGVMALLWLARASKPAAELQPAYGAGRRRTR